MLWLVPSRWRGQLTDVYKIREAFPKALATGLLGDRFPNEEFGIAKSGRLHIAASVQTITNGKSDPSVLYAWWPKTQKEFEKVKKLVSGKDKMRSFG